MLTAVDTNIISALWSKGPPVTLAVNLLGTAQAEGGIVICAAVYAELLAHPKATPGYVDEFLLTTPLTVDYELDRQIWSEAGRAYGEYAKRRRKSAGGIAKRLLMDFVIGAHALLRADQLLTLDRARYARAFPKLRIMPLSNPSNP